MGIRPFVDTIREQRNGRLLEELGEKLNELVAEVGHLQKPGSLTLTLKIKPIQKGDGTAVHVIDDVKVKLPEPESDGSIFFITPENNLSRRDARQAEMELGPRAVPKADEAATA